MNLRTLTSVAFACALCLAPAACGSGTLIAASVPANDSTYLEQAALAAQSLQTWYNSGTGLYASPSGWWNAANAITALVNYERVANDATYVSAIANTFSKAQTGSSGHTNFTNTFYDDTGWWGLAWIDAYDLTGNKAYLSMAESIFAYMTGGWDTATCGGGMWWSTNHTYKNAITNELFLTMAAKLANRTSDPASANYLAWAQKEWTWFQASGMINASGLINDGLNSSNPAACKNNSGIVWSYNQGVVLGGLVELSQATSDPALLARAQSIADAVLSSASPLINPNGILVDHGVSGGDAPQFKGIFLRNLATLYAAAPSAQFKSFADANADSIWTNDNSATRFGALWQGPVDSTDATRQTSALDALVAAAAMK
ncbi:MAG TPA: glycoside hydrolase family 76 protein [Acidobacteriaceae bacterium]|nr:glycoside hydrolase family 76 protein [Acidobacteriaceae bacterium]